MKRVFLLTVFVCLGLSSFAQIVMEPKSPLFRPNQINIIFRSMGDTLKIVSDIETIGTFSMKILIGEKCKKMKWGGGQGYFYKGKIADTMRFVFDAPDYQRDTFIYYKKIHYDPYASIAFFYITPKGEQVNKIVILGDAVDVYVGGEKYSYTVQGLGRVANDEAGNAQMLLKIPDLTFKDYIIHVKNQPIRVLFVDKKGINITGKAPKNGLLKELHKLTQ